MNKMKLEIFFMLLLMMNCFFMFVLFMYMILNNCCYIISWEIFNVMSLFVELDILLDWVSCSFSGLVCLISSSICIFSVSYMKGDMHVNRFMMVLMLFVLSMNFLIFIPSFVSLILGWDGLGLVSFCLVIYYQNNKSLSAGMLTVLMNRVGDCFILAGISIMSLMGHWNYLCIWYFIFFEICMFFVVIAGMTKSAQIPFSSWLPAAMAAPTPVSALVHSSTLVTAGVFLLIRFYNYLVEVSFFCNFLLFISILTTFMSGICAVYEYDMKKIIALSTLSQLGVMMMSLGLKMPMLSLFHLYTHAMFKALLFLCGGNIIHSFFGMQDIRDMKGVSYMLPFTSIIFNVSNMALCGFPFLAGFYSKDLIIEMVLNSNMNMLVAVFAMFGVCLTMLYSMRMSMYMVWGDVKSAVYENMMDDDKYVIISMLILCMGALFGGFFLQTMVFCFNEVIILPMLYKLMVLFLLMFSLLFSFSLWMFSMNKMDYNLIYWCNSKMWFMSSLSGYPFMMLIKNVSNLNLKLVDMGWLEMLGGQGILMMIKKLMYIMEWWMIILFNFNLIIVMFIIFMF
uniref:NADH-ubiquinone oxidoreductase chain 5 n=2 Tax=Amphioctopus fangsiao TaxID=515817 RepID=A0A344AYI6_AMPFA|nr:NADH dehydrogenase subunit 5 [Amphioctopus fangsiao]AWX90705.1 NADH dehydrogenase subunit 5 [Amphioctopus fangsiao]AWX90717.1 NADH dehydrogenase subunit 5 [Amphioctopus fangsiao]